MIKGDCLYRLVHRQLQPIDVQKSVNPATMGAIHELSYPPRMKTAMAYLIIGYSFWLAICNANLTFVIRLIEVKLIDELPCPSTIDDYYHLPSLGLDDFS